MVNSVTNVTTKVQSTNDSSSTVKNEVTKETKNSFKEVLQNTKESEAKTESPVKEEVKTEDEKVIKALEELDKKLENMDLSQIISMLTLLNADPKDLLSLKESIQNGNFNNIKAVISKIIQNIPSNQIQSNVELAFNQAKNTVDNSMKSDEKGISDIILNITQNNQAINTSSKQYVQAKPGSELDLKSEIIAMLHKKIAEENLKPINDKHAENVYSKSIKVFPEVINRDYINSSKEDLFNNTNSVEAENLNNDKSNLIGQVSSSSTEKEEKLLKNLINQEKPKAVKDTADAKITNVLTRFEVSNLNKQEVVAESPTINKTSINMDLIKAVKYMDLNNLKELSVKVMPKDLGQIIIRLTMDNGIMKANITANNKETYDLLNSQLSAISNQLSEQNLSIQSFSLSLSNGENFLFNGNQGNSGEGQKQKQKSYGIDAIEDESIYLESEIQQDSNVNLLA